MTLDELAEAAVNNWNHGLQSCHQDGRHILSVPSPVDFLISTSRSHTGMPTSVLSSFNVPPNAVPADGDAFFDAIQATANALRALLGKVIGLSQNRDLLLALMPARSIPIV